MKNTLIAILLVTLVVGFMIIAPVMAFLVALVGVVWVVKKMLDIDLDPAQTVAECEEALEEYYREYPDERPTDRDTEPRDSEDQSVSS